MLFRRSEMYTQFWLENLEGRDHLEVLAVDGRVILEWMLKKWVRRVWTGFMWLRVGTSGRLL
jgi:hypothetical protein